MAFRVHDPSAGNREAQEYGGMTLPARKPRACSGILRRPKRSWPRHEKWVRGHLCCIADKHECEGPIVFAHVRTGTDGGTSEKPSSWYGISLCDAAHRLQHQIGEPAFERRFGIDMKRLAQEFAARSPDQKMKAAMRECNQIATAREG